MPVRTSRPTRGSRRIGAPPATGLETEAFKIIEAVNRRVYDVATLPTMLAGATDMAQVRALGVQCYGIGRITALDVVVGDRAGRRGKRRGINRVEGPMRLAAPKTAPVAAVVANLYSLIGPRVPAGTYTAKMSKD